MRGAPQEDSPDYAYDPAKRLQRTRRRWAVTTVTALRALLYVLAMGLMLKLTISSIGQAAEQLEGLLGPGTGPAPDDPGVRGYLASGILRTVAVVGGVIVARTVLAGALKALRHPPGGIYLGGEDAQVATVREARSAALAARSALARLRSSGTRRRLEPHVDSLDATTWTMATVMDADSPGLDQELNQRCASVKEVAAELEDLVQAERRLEILVPAAAPVPPPDAATLLEVNDVVLQAAHDEVRGLLRAIDALAGPATLAPDVDHGPTVGSGR